MTTTRPALRLLAATALVCAAALPVKGQVLVTENFSFAGSVSTNGWTAFSTAGSNALTAVPPSLVYPDLPSSGVGNALSFTNSGEDAYKPLSTTNSSGAIFTSFTAALNSAASGDYFYAFYDPSAVGGGYFGRVFARTNGSGFSFGISRNSDGTGVTYETNVRSYGTTYFVVAKMARAGGLTNDVVSLWVNPALGSVAEPAPGITNNSGSDNTNGIGTVAVRQGSTNSSPVGRIDSLLVGTAWAQVTPSSLVTNVPSITSFSPTNGSAGTLVTINGTNFTGATSVTFNGASATFSAVDDGQITATVPSAATAGPISVTTGSGVATTTNSFSAPTMVVVLPAAVSEFQTGTGEVRLNEAPTNDLTVTLTSSSTNDFTVETPVVISTGTTNYFFNYSVPADNVTDADTNVVVTPTAVGFGGVSATVTVLNIDAAKIPLTSLASNSYTQNFDSLGTTTFSNVISGSTGAQTGLGDVVSTNLTGWFAAKIGGSGTSANLLADNGSGTSGAVYNYGSSGGTNRSLGGLASGTMVPGFGALVQNNTGSTLSSVVLSLTGKFWRSSTSVQNVLTFAYGVLDGPTVNGINFLTTIVATNLPAANIVGPPPVPSNGALDGNNPTNQVLLSNVVIPVQLLPGETMFLRWQDANDAGNDAGLAIDDLSLTASTNLALPVLAGVNIDPFSLGQTTATAVSAVNSEGSSTLTQRGFVYALSASNNNPFIGGPGVVVVTNNPPDIGTFSNTLTALATNAGYSIRSFGVSSVGTNYGAVTSFSTLPANPAFTGVYTQSFNGLTVSNPNFPVGWRCLSTSNANNFVGDWNATNSTLGGFYGRTNIPGIVGYLHTGNTGILSNRLTLVNNTGGTLTNLWVSYAGEVNTLNPSNNLRFPEWTVVVDGQAVPALTYSTAGGVNSNLVAEIAGLNITNGGNIVISWASDRGAGTNASRMIGMTDVRVATNAPAVTPTVNVTGSLTNFVTSVGTPSASQSLTVSGSNLTTNITVSTPAYYQLSTDNTNFTFVPLDLVPSGGTVTNTVIYFRLFATNYVGNANGTIFFDSVPATLQTAPVTGVVNGTFNYWLNGAPTNSANQLKYAIGGATGPTATNGVAPQTAVTSSNLSITAIVRTNDPNLSVFGEGLTNLNIGPWSTNGITTTVSPDQGGVPTGNQRRIFSIPRGTNTSQFLRLDSILLP